MCNDHWVFFVACASIVYSMFPTTSTIEPHFVDRCTLWPDLKSPETIFDLISVNAVNLLIKPATIFYRTKLIKLM